MPHLLSNELPLSHPGATAERQVTSDTRVVSSPKSPGTNYPPHPKYTPRFDKVDRIAWLPSRQELSLNTSPCPSNRQHLLSPREHPTYAGTRGNANLQIPAVKLFLPFGSADGMVFLSLSMRAQFAEAQRRKISILRRFNYTARCLNGKVQHAGFLSPHQDG